MTKVIKSPWRDKFFDEVKRARESIQVCSPFVKQKPIEEIYKTKSDSTSFELITKFNIHNFYKNSSDLEAMKFVLDSQDSLFNYQNLHAKIYLFDQKSAIVTSANLTSGGLVNNYEYGVKIDSSSTMKEVVGDFDKMKSSDLSGEINTSILDDINEILDDTPERSELDLPKFDWGKFEEEEIEEDEMYLGGTELIRKKLSGWTEQVFMKLEKIDKFIFTTEDIYSFREELQKEYPNNQNIEAKIRQQLQVLRDLGLLQFLERGKYKKLWI
jgi:phosphatidylserine/phosphatidylglycerophosphate/cardiolipin synthase-like enzyme